MMIVVFYVFIDFENSKDEKNQIMTSNVWLKQVSKSRFVFELDRKFLLQKRNRRAN